MEEHRCINEMDTDDFRRLGNFTFNLNREQIVARMERAEAQRDMLLAALKDIASSQCCQTSGCSIGEPMCDTMIARAAIAGVKGE